MNIAGYITSMYFQDPEDPIFPFFSAHTYQIFALLNIWKTSTQ